MQTATSPTIRRDEVVVGVGVALLTASILLSSVYARADGDLDWSVFGVGLLATGALLVMAAIGLLGFADRDLNVALASWPIAVGAIGVGLTVAVAMDTGSATPWIAGLLITAIGAAGYAAVRRPAPALAVVVGLLVLYVKVVSEVLDDVLDGNSDNTLMTIGAVVVAFTLVVTGVAALLPGRDVIAVTVGAVGGWFLVTVVASTSLFGFLGALGGGDMLLSCESSSGGGGCLTGQGYSDPLEGLHDDIYVLLILGMLLVLAWAVLGMRSGHAGYRVLIVGLATTQVPLSIAVLGVDHPSWWAALVAGAGALFLVAALVRARSSAATPPPHQP